MCANIFIEPNTMMSSRQTCHFVDIWCSQTCLYDLNKSHTCSRPCRRATYLFPFHHTSQDTLQSSHHRLTFIFRVYVHLIRMVAYRLHIPPSIFALQFILLSVFERYRRTYRSHADCEAFNFRCNQSTIRDAFSGFRPKAIISLLPWWRAVRQTVTGNNQSTNSQLSLFIHHHHHHRHCNACGVQLTNIVVLTSFNTINIWDYGCLCTLGCIAYSSRSVDRV